jgi:miniconductance mechanosensitive channel
VPDATDSDASVNEIINKSVSWLEGLPVIASELGGLTILLLVGIVADLVIKRVLTKLVRRAAKGTRGQWDDIIVERNAFGRLAQIVPALVIYFGVRLMPGLGEKLITVIGSLSLAYVALMVVLTIEALLSAASEIYESYPVSRERPIKGFIQITKIAVYMFGGIIVVSILMNKSPVVFLTGFGAMTAILLLIFRDTILSLVASIQMTSLDMVRVGDWIEMPQYNANGDVVDVALHTIKVQNWDKTITTIPTHKLISESFKNWRGMKETGGRRIKRSINIDVNSVRFLSEEEIEHFKEFKLLQDYIVERQQQLADYNAKLGDTANVNLRRLTNFGTFRAYLRNYLLNHPRIRKDMTLMVRQLQPDETGVPVEIYCFTNTTEWSEYERIQADIFDHILAQSPEFGLNVFQSPSGRDFRRLGSASPIDPQGVAAEK